jgi:hypothetical protein
MKKLLLFTMLIGAFLVTDVFSKDELPLNIVIGLDFKDIESEQKAMVDFYNSFINVENNKYGLSVYSRLQNSVLLKLNRGLSKNAKRKAFKRALHNLSKGKTNDKKLDVPQFLTTFQKYSHNLLNRNEKNLLILISNMQHIDSYGVNFTIGYPNDAFIKKDPFLSLDRIFYSTKANTDVYILHPDYYSNNEGIYLENWYAKLFNMYVGNLCAYERFEQGFNFKQLLNKKCIKQENLILNNVDAQPNIISYKTGKSIFKSVENLILKWKSTGKTDLDLIVNIEGINYPLDSKNQLAKTKDVYYSHSRVNGKSIELVEMRINAGLDFNLKDHLKSIYVHHIRGAKPVKVEADLIYIDSRGKKNLLKKIKFDGQGSLQNDKFKSSSKDWAEIKL